MTLKKGKNKQTHDTEQTSEEEEQPTTTAHDEIQKSTITVLPMVISPTTYSIYPRIKIA